MKQIEVLVPFEFCDQCKNFRMRIDENNGKEVYSCAFEYICADAIDNFNASKRVVPIEIKPCSNCGSRKCEVFPIDHFEAPDTYVVDCCDCGTAGPQASTEEEAIKAWNEM